MCAGFFCCLSPDLCTDAICPQPIDNKNGRSVLFFLPVPFPDLTYPGGVLRVACVLITHLA